MPDLATWNTQPRTIPTIDAGDWRDEAECLTESPELFFMPEYERAAQSICATCPVAMACLNAAMADEGTINGPSRFGVWGGLTPTQRASLSRSTRRKPPTGRALPDITHGTARGYAQHRRRGQTACDPCREAETRRVQDSARRRREADAS